ncbi:MAG: DUF4783 domain-containing protein [Ignavibacteriales bacterium]
MKTLLTVLLFVFMPSLIFSQGFVPNDVEMALSRIEQAFRTASPQSIEDMIPSSITMRLQDSLYQSISSIQAMNVLKSFFDSKKDISFQLTTPGHGTMSFTDAATGKKETVAVDLWMARHMTGPTIYALNISNYPQATVFYNIPGNKK